MERGTTSSSSATGTSHKMKKILFTGGGGAATEALVSLLADRYEVHFADADPDARPDSVAPNRWHTIPFASDDAFVDGVRATCRAIGADLLAPTVDGELLPLATVRQSLGCEVLLPSTEFIGTHLDKLKSNESLAAGGLPVPRTAPAVSRGEIRFPCVVKPRSG